MARFPLWLAFALVFMAGLVCGLSWRQVEYLDALREAAEAQARAIEALEAVAPVGVSPGLRGSTGGVAWVEAGKSRRNAPRAGNEASDSRVPSPLAPLDL